MHSAPLIRDPSSSTLRFLATILLLASSLAGPGPCPAAMLVSWDFAGALGDEVQIEASGAVDGVLGDPLVRGAGLRANAGADSFNSSGWESAATTPSADDEYLRIGFRVGENVAVHLERMSFTSRASAGGPGMISIYSSIDAFASPLATFVQPDSVSITQSIDLSALAVVTGAIELRFIESGNTRADGAGPTTGTGTFRLAQSSGEDPFGVRIEGVLVPEPVDLAGLGTLLATAALAARRRPGRSAPPRRSHRA